MGFGGSGQRIWLLVVALCGGAIVFHFTFLQYAYRSMTTYEDYSEVYSTDLEPLLVYDAKVYDYFCVVGQPEPCARAMYFERGIYPRLGTPALVSIIGGAVIPYLMLVVAGVLSSQRIRGRFQTIVATFCSVLGVVILALPVAVAILAVMHGSLDQLLYELVFPIFVVLLIFGTTLLYFGMFHWVARIRSKKIPGRLDENQSAAKQ